MGRSDTHAATFKAHFASFEDSLLNTIQLELLKDLSQARVSMGEPYDSS